MRSQLGGPGPSRRRRPTVRLDRVTHLGRLDRCTRLRWQSGQEFRSHGVPSRRSSGHGLFADAHGGALRPCRETRCRSARAGSVREAPLADLRERVSPLLAERSQPGIEGAGGRVGRAIRAEQSGLFERLEAGQTAQRGQTGPGQERQGGDMRQRRAGFRPAVVQRRVTNGYRAIWAAQGEADMRTVVATAAVRTKAPPSPPCSRPSQPDRNAVSNSGGVENARAEKYPLGHYHRLARASIHRSPAREQARMNGTCSESAGNRRPPHRGRDIVPSAVSRLSRAVHRPLPRCV